MIKEITIIGLGFTGVSLGLALKHNLPDVVVTGIDKGSVIIRAKTMGALDNGCLFTEMEHGIKKADLVFFATSIQATKELFPRVSDCIKENAVATDTCNVKCEVVNLAEQLFKNKAVFIGGHPIIGYKRGGIEQADPNLFLNTTYVLTPAGTNGSKALSALQSVIEAIGARVILMSPENHDDLCMKLNHILQLIAVVQVNTIISELDDERAQAAIAVSGERFKQFTEALLTPSFFWEEIFNSNYSYVEKNVEIFIENLKLLMKELKSKGFQEKYERAKRFVNKVYTAAKGFSKSLFHLYVTIEDKTGSIAKLTSLVASGGFNIKDIGVVKIKEGEAAVIRLSFINQSTASKAGSFLIRHGYLFRTQYDYEEFCI